MVRFDRQAAVSILLSAVFSLAGAQSAAPTLSVGDFWTYTFDNKLRPDQNNTYTWTVSTVSPAGYLLNSENSRGAKSVVTMGPSLNVLFRKDGTLPWQERKRMAWPAQDGQTWTYSFPVRLASGVVLQYDMEAKVVGKEEITLPSGKFEATRVMTTGKYTRDSDGKSGQVTEVIWYTAGVKQPVRILFQGTDVEGKPFDDIVIELTKFGAAVANVAFDGKWTGTSEPRVNDCVKGDYEIEISGGKVTGAASFYSSGGVRKSAVSGQVGADNGLAVTLAAQGANSRSGRFQGKFENNEFKAIDPPPAGGRCAYDVVWKKKI